MLASLVTYNSSVTAAYTEVIADIKCPLLILHSDECFIQEQHNKSFVDLCWHIGSSSNVELYMLVQK